MDLIVEFVSRNLVAQINFVRFRDNRKFSFFEAMDVCDKWHDATWHMRAMWMPHGLVHVSPMTHGKRRWTLSTHVEHMA